MEGQTGLDMKTRKKICNEIYRRYQKAGKKGKSKILDEYTITLGYNRDYLACLLSNWDKKRYTVIKGRIAKEPVKDPKKPCKGRKTGRPVKYNEPFLEALKEIWELFDYQCGRTKVRNF